jgi:hypothetical protein
MRSAMKDLLTAGLIQRMALPEFDPSIDEEESQERKNRRGRKNKARGTDEKKPQKTRRSGAICKRLQTFDASAEPFAGNTELTTGKRKRKLLNGQLAKRKGQGQRPATPAALPPGEGQGPGPLKPQAVTAQGGRHSTPQGERQPAITPPARVSGNPKILPIRDGDAAAIGHLLPRAVGGLAHGYALRADDFAREIFNLLQAPFTDESRDGVRELGNYRAALLEAIDAGLGPGDLEDLMRKARHDAVEIAKHRKRYYRDGGNPEAYWRFLFNKHLAARLPSARAGPTATATG